MTKEEIGAILKSLRNKTGMTQKEVAELLGRKQQIIGHWETGYAQPDANTLFKLCEIYNTTVDEAFGFAFKSPSLTAHQKKVISAYIAHPEMQAAVDKLLGITREEPEYIFRAAKSNNNAAPEIKPRDEDTMRRLRNIPGVTSEEDL